MFEVVNESTEDTLATAKQLSDAIAAAKEAARQGPAGDLVTVLDNEGLGVRQFVLLADGTVAELPTHRGANRSGGEPGLNVGDKAAAEDRPQEHGPFGTTAASA